MEYVRTLALVFILMTLNAKAFDFSDSVFWINSALMGLILHRVFELYRERGEAYKQRWGSLVGNKACTRSTRFDNHRCIHCGAKEGHKCEINNL